MDGKQTILRDELAKHIGKTVFIGARSSYFFAGNAEDALVDLPIVSLMLAMNQKLSGRKAGSAKVEQMLRTIEGVDLGARPVKNVYERSEDGDIAIIIEGREFGFLWTLEEYVAHRNNFVKALEKATSGANK